MKNIVLFSGHPDIAHSTANRIIMEELVSNKSIIASDIKLNYPDYNFDIEKEQELLRSADLVVLQTPFVWYGLPAHVKLWMEKVFTWGFAHGAGGDKLKDKSFLLSLTMGGNAEAYSAAGQHQHPVEHFLKPVELFVQYCGLKYLAPVYSHSMSANTEVGKSLLESRAILHASNVKKRITQFLANQEIDSHSGIRA